MIAAAGTLVFTGVCLCAGFTTGRIIMDRIGSLYTRVKIALSGIVYRITKYYAMHRHGLTAAEFDRFAVEG